MKLQFKVWCLRIIFLARCLLCSRLAQLNSGNFAGKPITETFFQLSFICFQNFTYKTATAAGVSWATEFFPFYVIILKLNNRNSVLGGFGQSVGFGTLKQQNSLFLCRKQYHGEVLGNMNGVFPLLCEIGINREVQFFQCCGQMLVLDNLQ